MHLSLSLSLSLYRLAARRWPKQTEFLVGGRGE